MAGLIESETASRHAVRFIAQRLLASVAANSLAGLCDDLDGAASDTRLSEEEATAARWLLEELEEYRR